MRMSTRTAGGTGACLWLYSVCGCSIPYAVNILSAMHCGKRPRRCSRAGHAAQPLCGASKRVTISMVGGCSPKSPSDPGRPPPQARARPSPLRPQLDLLPTASRPKWAPFVRQGPSPPNDPRALALARFRSVCSIRVHTAAKPPLRKASHGRGRMPRKPQKRNRYPISIALPASPGGHFLVNINTARTSRVVEADEAVYPAYCQGARHERYLSPATGTSECCSPRSSTLCSPSYARRSPACPGPS